MEILEEESIGNQNELTSLFKEWIEAQRNDENNTGVFVSDGPIYNDYFNSKKRILFTLKESHYFSGNSTPKLKGQKIVEDPQSGFYKGFFDDECTNKDEQGNPLVNDTKEPLYIIDKKTNIIIPKAYAIKSIGLKYFDNKPKQKEKIARMAEYILEDKITSSYGSLKKALRQIAFMNINKMGGSDTTDPEDLNMYYNNYSKFIKEQIKILNPQIIIMMVNNAYIEKSLKDQFKNIKFINMLHTAARGKNLNLTTEEEAYYKKLSPNKTVGEEGPYIKFCSSTEKYLAKFIYRYENSTP